MNNSSFVSAHRLEHNASLVLESLRCHTACKRSERFFSLCSVSLDINGNSALIALSVDILSCASKVSKILEGIKSISVMSYKGRSIISRYGYSSGAVLAGVERCGCIKSYIVYNSLNKVVRHILTFTYLTKSKLELGFGNDLGARLVCLGLFSFGLRLCLGFVIFFVVVFSFFAGLILLFRLVVASLLFSGIGKLYISLDLSRLNSYYSEDTLASCVNNFEINLIKRSDTECGSCIFFCLNNVLAAGNYFLYHNGVVPFLEFMISLLFRECRPMMTAFAEFVF